MIAASKVVIAALPTKVTASDEQFQSLFQLWPLCLARVLAFFAAAMTVLAPQISAGSGIAAAGVAEFVRERGEDLVGEIAEILGGAVC